jgi:serine/threonine protein phosphatase 1
VVAIGDIHGEIDLLDRLLADLRARLDGETTPAAFVFLGDYVDRGPDSAGVVQRLCDLEDEGADTAFLLGNHEVMMRLFLDRGDVAAAETWLANGGAETMESYGVAPPRITNLREELPGARAALAAALPARHRRFMDGLAPARRIGELIFVHAGVRPGVPLEAQRETDLVWIREAFLDSTADHGGLVVHGHTTRFGPEVRSNRIGIDTGAGKGGYLTAAIFWGSEVSFLHVAA